MIWGISDSWTDVFSGANINERVPNTEKKRFCSESLVWNMITFLGIKDREIWFVFSSAQSANRQTQIMVSLLAPHTGPFEFTLLHYSFCSFCFYSFLRKKIDSTLNKLFLSSKDTGRFFQIA